MIETTTSQPLSLPSNGMVITRNTTLKPGVYLLPDGITIDADNVTLDGNGATIIGANRRGVAVTVKGRRNVTIRNLRVREYYHGIVARDCSGLTIEHNDITGTAEVELNTVFLNITTPASEAYGAAILLERVSQSEIRDNEMPHQMNGLLSYFCHHLRVLRNNASYCSGFGFHLYNTCDSLFESNWADYCNRYEPRDPGKPVIGVGHYGHMGADATGFLIIHASCRNIFRRNFARCGGDGFFLAGRIGDQALGCDENLFEENDASLSPNIAFEATFSAGNIFRNNWADRCNFGFWLGFSAQNVLEGNRMLFNRQAAIGVENGVDFEVRGNDFQSNGTGVLLWTKYIESFYRDCPELRTIRNWKIEENHFLRNNTAIAILADKDHGVRSMPEDASNKPELRPCDNIIRANDIQEGRIGIHLQGTDRTVIEKNKLNRNCETDIRREDDRDTTIGHNLGHRGAYL